MPVYYFEIIQETKGWLRLESDSYEEAEADVQENGFNASDILGAEEYTEVIIEESSEVKD